MNTKIALAFYITFYINTICVAAAPLQVADLNQKLHDPNPQVRIEAAERFIQQLGGDSANAAGNAVLPLFATALSDAEPKVRYYAAVGIESVAYDAMSKYAPLRPGTINIQSFQLLRTLLLKTIDDPDAETRQAALAAYTLSYLVEASLQDKLSDRFDSEQRNPLLQQVMLAALTMDGSPSTKATTLLNRLLSAPKTNLKVAKALIASPAPPPVSLLPQLITQILTADDSDHRAEIMRAITKYGSQAKPYLDQLDAIKNKEADPSVKQLIQTNIQAIVTAP